MTQTKKFDCVKWAREARTRLQEETRSMKPEEVEQFFRQRAHQSSFWRRLTQRTVKIQSANRPAK